jgi:hypothetical protein
MRAANHAADEQWKKKKDAETRKKQKKAKAQLERGGWCQGLDEEDEDEDEEEEEGDVVPWDDLANEDEPVGSGLSS